MHAFIPYNIYGIIGYPLEHSLSPLIHTISFRDANIPAVLVPFPTPPTELDLLFQSIRLLNIRGLCVTIPHKQSVIPYLDKVTDRVKKIGAVNLIYWDKGQLCGDNTDILGFMAPLQKKTLPKKSTRVLLLGAGGAARSAIIGLQELGYSDITITGTTLEKALHLAQLFGLSTISWEERGDLTFDIVINSTPLGMTGKFEKETPYQKEWFKGQGIAYDIVYTPNHTRFITEAKDAGWDTILGLDMFIGQAEAQFKIWTDKNLSAEAIKKVIKQLSNE